MKFGLRSLMIVVLLLLPLVAVAIYSFLIDPTLLFVVAGLYVLGYIFFRAI